MKLTIALPAWSDEDPEPLVVEAEHSNPASFDLLNTPLRATAYTYVDEEYARVHTMLEVDAFDGHGILTVRLPGLTDRWVGRVLGSLGVAYHHEDGPRWIETRLDDAGGVAWMRTAYDLRLLPSPYDRVLMASAGWPLDQGIGGSMVLPMRLAVLHERHLSSRRDVAPAVAPTTCVESTEALDGPLSGTVVDPGPTPRDYSGDRGWRVPPEALIPETHTPDGVVESMARKALRGPTFPRPMDNPFAWRESAPSSLPGELRTSSDDNPFESA